MTEDIFNVGYDIWNNLITIAMTLFTTSPTAASGSVHATTRALYNAISSVGLPITIVFFLTAICKDAIISSSPNRQQQVMKILNDALKFTIMIGILANLWDVMGYIMQIADGVTDRIAGYGAASYMMSMSDDMKMTISEVENLAPTTEIHVLSFGSDLLNFVKELISIVMTKLLFFITSLISLVIIVASCISILSSSFQRILKPLLILPFSSITVAMASGSAEASRVTISYIKTFFGFCISGAFMVICVKLGVALTTGGLIAFNISTMGTTQKMLFMSVQNMITPIVIAGLIKSVDSIIGRFF